MRVLIISDIFPPDMGGSSTRAFNVAKGLLSNSVEVLVVAAFPHYPDGDVPQRYRRRAMVRELVDGVSVIRTFVPAMASRGTARRILLYLSFVITSLFPMPFVGNVDAVFASNPQILSFIPAMIYKARYRCRLVLNVDDVWPESFSTLRMASKSVLVGVGSAMARVAYSSSNLITPVSPSYLPVISGKYGVPASKVEVIEGGVDLSFYSDAPKVNGSGFLILYIGSFSEAYDFEQVLKAAEILRNEKGLTFLLQGAGEMLPVVSRRVSELGLENVEVVSKVVSRKEVASMLCQADILLLPLARLRNDQEGISSKLYEYQASGRPIVCCSAGVSGRYVSDTSSGLVVTPGDYRSLAETIMKLHDDPVLAQELGESGRRYVSGRLSVEMIGSRVKKAIENLRES